MMIDTLKFFCLFSFFALSYAEDRCDWFSIKPHGESKIYYSKAYGKALFLDEKKPGIYFVVRRNDAEVDVFFYVNDKNDVVLYMEPGFVRNESTEDFYPCIDKHVKANLNHYKQTCSSRNVKVNENLYGKTVSFLDRNFYSLIFYCDCASDYYAEIYQVKSDGKIRMVSFHNPLCLEKNFQGDMFLEDFFSIARSIEKIANYETAVKCNWRNLVKNPEKFSSEKFRTKDYLLILNGNDCPAL